MSGCVVVGCRNKRRKKIPGVTFHRFPKNQKIRDAWIKAVRRKNWEPKYYSAVCSDHFYEKDMDKTSLAIIRIRENAVPTIFDSNHSDPPLVNNGNCELKRTSRIQSVAVEENSSDDNVQKGDNLKPSETFLESILKEPLENFVKIKNEDTLSEIDIDDYDEYNSCSELPDSSEYSSIVDNECIPIITSVTSLRGTKASFTDPFNSTQYKEYCNQLFTSPQNSKESKITSKNLTNAVAQTANIIPSDTPRMLFLKGKIADAMSSLQKIKKENKYKRTKLERFVRRCENMHNVVLDLKGDDLIDSEASDILENLLKEIRAVPL